MTYQPLIVVVLVVIGHVNGMAKCPRESAPIGSPCAYIDLDYGCGIECGGDKKFDIIALLNDVKQKLPKDPQESQFDYIMVNNTAIEELPAQAFAGIQTYGVYLLNALSLRRVHVQAFNGTVDNVMDLLIQNSPVSERVSADGQWDVFGAIRSVRALQSVAIDKTNIAHMPTGAIANLTELQEVRIYNNPIESFAAHALDSLPELISLQIHDNHPARVAAHAFTVGPSAHDLTLKLELFDTPVTVDTLSVGAFDSMGRAVHLWVDEKPLGYLPENVFNSFLVENPLNSLQVSDFVCADTHNAWIHDKYPAVWKSLNCKL